MTSGRHPSEKMVEKCKQNRVFFSSRKTMIFLGGKIGCEWICGTDFWYSYSAVGGVFLVATFWQSLVENDFRKIPVVKIGRKNRKSWKIVGQFYMKMPYFSVYYGAG